MSLDHEETKQACIVNTPPVETGQRWVILQKKPNERWPVGTIVGGVRILAPYPDAEQDGSPARFRKYEAGGNYWIVEDLREAKIRPRGSGLGLSRMPEYNLRRIYTLESA